MLQNSYKVLAIFIFCLYNSNVYAQIPEPSYVVEPTVEFANKKKERLRKMLLSDDSGHYALFGYGKNGKGKKSIRKFSIDLQPMDYRIDLSFRKKVVYPSTLDVVVIENKIYHIYTAKTREGIDYYSQEIDVKLKKIISEKLIARVNHDEALYDYTEAKIMIDKDSARIYLNIQLVNNLKNNKKIRFYVYDKNLEKIRTDNYEIPIANTQFKVSFLKPYGSNNIILFGKYFQSENWTKSSRKKEYEYLIYSLTENKTTLLHTISPNDQHLKTILAKIEKDNLLVTGILNNQSVSKPSSLYFLNYNLANSKVEQEKENRLPDNFYNYPENRDDKVSDIQFAIGSKKRMADSYYDVRNFITTPENELILIAEQNFVVESNSSMSLGGMTTYHSKDIAIFKLNLSGELIWTKKVIKRQAWSENATYLSFYPTYKNNKLFLFYNGNYLNIESSGNFLGENDSGLLCTIVQNDGSYQRHVIAYYTEEYPIVAIPLLSGYSKKYGTFIYSRAPGNAKRQKFTRVTLN